MKIITGILIAVELILIVSIFFGHNYQLLNPQGPIARHQRDLGLTVIFLILIVAAPTYVMTFLTAYKYREENKKAKHEPDRIPSKFTVAAWWLVPSLIIFIIATLIWKNTHALDPYKPLESGSSPITIQVISLQWKWLFIYPNEGIATINYIQFPEKTPVNFELTSDAPMNSFWIPSLGGQIYTMTGMTTKLHLLSDKVGQYPGLAAEISGKGFTGMKFIARASTKEEYDVWVQEAKDRENILDISEYERLVVPSENNKATIYSDVSDGLFKNVVMKYMAPSDQMTH